MARPRIGGEKDFRVGDRVRVVPGTPPDDHCGTFGLSTRGQIVNINYAAPELVLVEWEPNHAGDRRPRHRETIAVEHIEPA